ncbi:MAG TPA: DUF5684 domain-containing protein [Anaeromyxobacteraceae bacterium]|nr:DUF5684 domain-containing protein [Anaeromyxobacteraceae bacterium]
MNSLLPTLEAMALTQYGDYQGPSTAQSVVWFAVVILVWASFWKICVKAGRQGWEGIIPIYNLVVLLQIVKRPIWWIVLLLIPLVNVVIAIVLLNDLAKSFGKGVGWTLGLIFIPFVFFPILGFGSDPFRGRPAAATRETAQ